jgi:diguanylate cyclase (GGDEF)-like protein
MFGISKKTVIKASVAAFLSVVVSVTIALVVVPMLGGHPDGPGFLMSIVCPVIIAWPASAYQFTQTEKIRMARDKIATMHGELDAMHHELLLAHAALQEKSRIDGMTGALNRETFFALLESASSDHRPSTLLVVDADRFKRINDTFGHQCGDDALRGIAQAIASSIRDQDFWGRIGGEEFAIFLDDADEETARSIAETIRLSALAIDLKAEGETIPVSVSIGGACAASGFEPKALVNRADRRLYRAKRAGRNCVVMEDDAAESAAA